ncbi:head-tail connector protein [Candidatus Rickettsia colombianensi]|uniref:head-tail connector protein n=1 Tax=Candidatus Rickettsia colombianensi TaxID=1090944 RepID=UPI001FE4280F|nr:head-tail connector protein [Candidatus Rickettsia colombianensi]
MRVGASYDDDLIVGLIDAAITAAENFTKLNFISKQIKFICNTSGKEKFSLKYNPLLTITKIKKKFKDQENDLAVDNYMIDQNILTLNKVLNNEEMYDRQATNCLGLSKEVKIYICLIEIYKFRKYGIHFDVIPTNALLCGPVFPSLREELRSNSTKQSS